MFDHRFTGSVLVNGAPRQVNIEGNPYGRTVIQVDGATVYNKKPFVQKQDIDFEVLPGKPAVMHWHQISAFKLECDIIVDNKSTTLATLAKDGTVRGPVGTEARNIFQTRYTGFGLLAGAGFCFLLNYFSLTSDGYYYPKALACVPVFVLMGVVSLAHPKLDISPENKAMVWIMFGVGLLAVLFGFTLFKDWFLATFTPQ